jgi:hypothetical protein
MIPGLTVYSETMWRLKKGIVRLLRTRKVPSVEFGGI